MEKKLGVLPFIYFKFCNVGLVSAIKQCESAIIIHPLPLGLPSSSPSRPSQSTRLGSCACCTATSHQLSILHLMVLYVDAAFSIHLTLFFPCCVKVMILHEKRLQDVFICQKASKLKYLQSNTKDTWTLQAILMHSATGSLNNYKTGKENAKNSIVNKQYVEEFFFFFGHTMQLVES